MKSFLVAFVALCLVENHARNGGRFLTVFQKIGQDNRLSRFFHLLQTNRVCKSSLGYREVTVFAPTDEAFDKFDGSLTPHLSSYHVVYGARAPSELDPSIVESVQHGNPPLWVSRRDGDVFVNNALVLSEPKTFWAKTRQDIYGKPQVMYAIDEVLDPVVKNMTNPTAYDFLSRTPLWTSAWTASVFFSAVIHNRLENFFRSEGNYTFFLPVDAVSSDYRLEFLDAYSVKAHIVPNFVLFTRPARKHHPYETLTTGDYISVLVSLVAETGKYFVRGHTVLGDSNHPTGAITAEILLANVPVKNGVVHLISKPLALATKKLGKFPYPKVLEKFSQDPMLNTSYVMGANSDFNEYLKLTNKKFTFFVPRDVAWRRLRHSFDVQTIMRPGYYHWVKQVMERHLVIGEVPVSMETLEKASARTCVNVSTPAGRVCLAAKKVDSGYELRWKRQRIAVSRPDYECSDGMVHVIDAPFMDDDDFAKFTPRSAINFVHIWNALHRLLI